MINIQTLKNTKKSNKYNPIQSDSLNRQMNLLNTTQKKYQWSINTWKILNIFNHYKFANQNYSAIPFHLQ
jgi:hypothetical protein